MQSPPLFRKTSAPPGYVPLEDVPPGVPLEETWGQPGDVRHHRHVEWQARLIRAKSEIYHWNIVTTGENVWQVETRPGHVYTVRWDGSDWTCTCPDYRLNFLGECKHTLGVQLLIQSVQSQSVNQIQTEVSEMEDEKILEQLGRPFPAKAVQWKVGARNQGKSRGIALAYVDSRDYIERLNVVLGLCWEDAYTFTVVGTRLVCKCELRLHLKEGQSIVRTGDGECELADENATTVASAQAFKRACVKFGLGAYLYGLPLEWVDLESEKYISPEVQASLCDAYKRWIETGEWTFLSARVRYANLPPTPASTVPAPKPAPVTAPKPAPVTAPAPSTAPKPAPVTAPAPSTAPKPAPVTAPAPSTKPAPVTAPAPSTAPVAASSTKPVKPVPAPVAAANALGPGTFLVTHGEYRGQCIAQIYAQNPEYVQWLAEKAISQPLRTAAQTFLSMQTG